MQESPRVYSFYGFHFRSYLPLPYQECENLCNPDVDIFPASARWFEEAAGPMFLAGPSWYHHAPLPDGSTYLRWGDLFEFLVAADGRRIACRPLGDSSEAFHTYLLGQVLSFALVKQGIEPLHATTVVVHGAAVGFLGSSGDGKSSLGAAFLAAGHPLLTDDLLVARFTPAGCLVYPGPPRIKLYPEIARRLLGEDTGGTPMNNLTPKIILPLRHGQHHGCPAPLRRLYLLRRPGPRAKAGRVTIRTLSGRQAYLALTRHCFNTRVQERERLKRQFLSASDLASQVPVKLLSYPRDLTFLASVRDAILADLRRDARRPAR